MLRIRYWLLEISPEIINTLHQNNRKAKVTKHMKILIVLHPRWGEVLAVYMRGVATCSQLPLRRTLSGLASAVPLREVSSLWRVNVT